jgi:ABC-type uncharacterized transport system ATPase subunit
MKFTVKRSEWLRGHEGSCLLTPDGMRCCIGFVGQQCGVPDVIMQDVPSLAGAVHRASFDVSALESNRLVRKEGTSGVFDRPWLFTAYVINDDCTLDDSKREEKLTRLFERNGHQITFVD